jgi:hypothetical protein
MGFARSVAAFGAGLGFVACAAFSGLSDLSEVACQDPDCGINASDVASLEAGAPPGDAVREAPDVLAADVEDAHLGDAPVLDALAGGWCAGQPAHTFCDDFDESPLLSGWDNAEQSGGGALALDGVIYTSPHEALLATVDLSTPPSQARLVKSFSQASRIVLAFEGRVDSAPDSEQAAVASIWGASSHRVVLQFSVAMLKVDEIGPNPDGGAASYTDSHVLSVAPQIGAWAHVDFELDIGVTTNSVSISIGGEPATVFSLSANFVPGPPTVRLGADVSTASQGGWAMRYDDVTVDLTP